MRRMNEAMPSKKEYSFWFVPVLSWIAYASAYLGRMNLSITIPYLQNELGFSKAALGFLASGFFISYAAGQFINGILGDHFEVRKFITLGLLVAGISNLSFSLFRTFPLMLLFWSLNGYFQSMLWGPLLRTISDNVPQNRQYKATIIMSTAPATGRFLAYNLAGRLSVSHGWELAFIVPGLILLSAAGLWYWGISKFRNLSAGATQISPPDRQEASHTSHLSGRKLFEFIIQSKLYLFILLGILIGIVREGLTLWGPTIFIELYLLDMARTLSIISVLPIINLCFTFVCGMLYKKFHSNERYAIFLFLLTAIFSAFLLWQVRSTFLFVNILFFFALLTSIHAANVMMTSYAPLSYKKEGRVSAAAGIIDSSFYLGAAIAGPIMGITAENFGWNGIFSGLLLICTIAAIIPGAHVIRTRMRQRAEL